MIYHALFWLCYYVFASLISLSIHHIYDWRYYAELLTLMPPDMVMVYVNLYLLIPAFLEKKNYPLYFGTILLTMTATSSLNIWLHHWYAAGGSTWFMANSSLTIPNLAAQLINSIYLVGLTSGLKFFKDSMEQRQRLQEQEKQQIALELNFLKAQVHPHFFFNTLNNLYSLTLQRSSLAPEVVLKLSSLMSYMLYESSAPFVPLDKELANLGDYIALEQLRFGSRLSLTFEKKGLPAESLRIPPLILLTFVENSFKHGIGQTIGEGRIDISLNIEQQHLIFDIDNSIGETVASASTSERYLSPNISSVPTRANAPSASGPSANGPSANGPSANGLGLRNVIRRLDLLYGSNYRLDKQETAGDFHVTLKIPLK